MPKAPIEGPLSLGGRALQEGDVILRRALHSEYGGNPQGGIAPLGSHLAIFIFTGASGEPHGYQDEWLPDGTFRYFGEGQRGDMQLKAGNRALDEHVKTQSRLFLFDTNSGKKRHVVYRGEFQRVRTGEDRGPDSEGKDRRRFYFDLEPLQASAPAEVTDSTEPPDAQTVFDEGREREIRTNRIERNRTLVEAAKKVHGLRCQACGFEFGKVYGPHGAGFIEVHHLIPVSEAAKKGRRTVNPRKEMAVLCANCHRMVHRGSRLLTIAELQKIVAANR